MIKEVTSKIWTEFQQHKQIFTNLAMFKSFIGQLVSELNYNILLSELNSESENKASEY